MTKTAYPGIDYSRGTANTDVNNGIRFGLLSMNTENLTSWIYEELEGVYPPRCPDCSNDLSEPEEASMRCNSCDADFEHRDHEMYGDEPDYQEFKPEGYEGHLGSNNELWITKSPYYMHAQFCSPCAPGAGNCNTECEDGPKTYCLGHDYYETSVAPYKVYSVETDEEVLPTKE